MSAWEATVTCCGVAMARPRRPGCDEQEVAATPRDRADPTQPGHARLDQLLPACRLQAHPQPPVPLCVVAGDPGAAGPAPLDVEGRPPPVHHPRRTVETDHGGRDRPVQPGLGTDHSVSLPGYHDPQPLGQRNHRLTTVTVESPVRGDAHAGWDAGPGPVPAVLPLMPLMPGMPERRSHDYVRHGTSSLFAALINTAFNITDGTVISALHRQHRAVEFRKFLVAIDKAVPADLDVHLICDNLATHKPPAIRDWLARHPRFHLHFTPTGSSWINQVERWFGLLTDQLIRRGVHKSVVALENDVREWIKNWNEDPKPFVWTKTAEDILQSLSKYIAKISDAGH